MPLFIADPSQGMAAMSDAILLGFRIARLGSCLVSRRVERPSRPSVIRCRMDLTHSCCPVSCGIIPNIMCRSAVDPISGTHQSRYRITGI